MVSSRVVGSKAIPVGFYLRTTCRSFWEKGSPFLLHVKVRCVRFRGRVRIKLKPFYNKRREPRWNREEWRDRKTGAW